MSNKDWKQKEQPSIFWNNYKNLLKAALQELQNEKENKNLFHQNEIAYKFYKIRDGFC